MFSRDVSRHLQRLDHEAVHALEVGLGGRPDREVLTAAAAQDRVVVTENARDFLPLLDQALARGERVPPVVIALRRTLPRDPGALAAELARRLDFWSTYRPTPYRHAHWLPHPR